MKYLLVFFCFFLSISFPADLSTAFDRFYVAQNLKKGSGWIAPADMDNDGDLDIVGLGGGTLTIFENDGNPNRENWPRSGNLDPTNEFTSVAVLLDIDGDGDLDLVVNKGKAQVGWVENPGPPFSNTPWTFHEIDNPLKGWYIHDMILYDWDRDGKKDEVVCAYQKGYWDAPIQIHVYKRGSDPKKLWEKFTIQSQRPGPNNNHAGFDLGDFNQDGIMDLAFSDGWYQAPASPGGQWQWKPLTSFYGISNTVAGDMDKDGDLDLVVTGGHHGLGVHWLENPGGQGSGLWVEHTINDQIENPEGTAMMDLDCDGDLDIVTCQLNFDAWEGENHKLFILENMGNGKVWDTHVPFANTYPPFHLKFADIDQDKKVDIITGSSITTVNSYFRGSIPNFPCGSTGIKHSLRDLFKRSHKIKLVSNPIRGNGALIFSIPFAGAKQGGFGEIFDLSGKLIQKNPLQVMGHQKFGIHLRKTMGSGTYLVRVKIPNHSARVQRFQISN